MRSGHFEVQFDIGFMLYGNHFIFNFLEINDEAVAPVIQTRI